MKNQIPIQPIPRFRATVRPPGSKSLTNRALVLAAALRTGRRCCGVLLADDSRQMFGALGDSRVCRRGLMKPMP